MHGSGIAIIGSIVRALVCIEEDMRLTPFELITGAAVRLQSLYVGAHQILQFLHFTSFIRNVMAFLWASNPSPAAIRSTARPIARTPSGVMCWKVTFLI